MPRFIALASFRHCRAGQVYEIPEDELDAWQATIDGGWLAPYPDDDALP